MKNRKSSSKDAAPAKSASDTSSAGQSDTDWASHIATAAYFKAEARGFAPGNELDDWIAAETELKDWTTTQMEAESC